MKKDILEGCIQPLEGALGDWKSIIARYEMSATLQDQIYAIAFLPDYTIPLVFLFSTTVEFLRNIFNLICQDFCILLEGDLRAFIKKNSAI